MAEFRHSLPKTERLSSKTGISTLMSRGHWGVEGPLRYCFFRQEGLPCTRIVVSVPKKLFRRAVKRNLLKRRLRESYRTQKHLLGETTGDLMIVYNSQEVLDSSVLAPAVAAILSQIAAR